MEKEGYLCMECMEVVGGGNEEAAWSPASVINYQIASFPNSNTESEEMKRKVTGKRVQPDSQGLGKIN
jgi:hypothetical protein